MSKPTSVEAKNILQEFVFNVDMNRDQYAKGKPDIYEGLLEQSITKINRLIVLAKLEGFDIAFDCHDYDRLRAYKEQLTKGLRDSEAEKNSGTWSRV